MGVRGGVRSHAHPFFRLFLTLGGWRGAALDLIRMRVQDDVRVAQVRVEITDEAGTVLEAGGATEAGALWWEYQVIRPLAGELTVTISASDLPGHVTQASEKKKLPG